MDALKRLLTFTVVLAAVVALVGAAACGSNDDGNSSGDTEAADVVAAAQDDGDLGTFVKAADTAGMTETLKGEGPFTVFAPSDAAFDALEPGTLDALLADPSGKLTQVLQYHVVPGEKLMKSDLAKGGQVETALEGEKIFYITGKDGELYVNNVKIVKTDIVGKNGVVHVIDGVLMPPE